MRWVLFDLVVDRISRTSRSRGRRRRVSDMALADECLWKPAPSQVAEHEGGEAARVELRRTVQRVGGWWLVLLRQRLPVFRREVVV